ncbi:hypothetical protein [Hoeflea sp.]|uniref:hypothetical protein n=1 Tax=Hoeflea sp. TaxID=1940281 RepID=UPI003B52679D
MSAIDGPLSRPLTAPVADQLPVPSADAAAVRADTPMRRAPLMAERLAPPPAPFRLPVWPSPGAINLAQDLLELSQTTFAYTATISRPESGPDFWDMLAAALPEPELD